MKTSWTVVFRLVLLILAVASLRVGTAAAQVGTASLGGQVTDASGAVLPGVTVTLMNTATGVKFTTVTNAQGRYAVPNLPIGTYDVTTELDGFDKGTQTGLRLGVGQQAELNMQMTIGAISEQLTVTASAVVVETTSASLGARVTEKQIESLPLNGRNFDQLSWLAPGVNQVASSSSPGSEGSSNNPFGRNASYSFAGLRPEGQAILLDGAELQGFWGRGSGSTMIGVSLGIEAVGEYQVLTNTYGAQFPGFGAVVNSVTKSGTNVFHGSAYEFYRNSKLDAKNYFDVGDDPPPFHRNQYGLSFGGPIRQSRAFFFVNYEALQQELSATSIGFVPNAATRNGFLPCNVLAVVPADCDRANPALVNVGVNPVMVPYLALYPLANGPDTGDGRARFTAVQNSPVNDRYLNARLDYSIGAADNLMGRYIIDKSDYYAPKGGSPIAGYGTNGDGKNQFLTIQERKVFGPTLVNTASIHVTRTNQLVLPEATGADAPLLNFMGNPSLAAGAITVTGLSALGSDRLLPIYNVQSGTGFSDSLSWVNGDHTVTLGGEVNHVVSVYDMPAVIGGQFQFQTLQQLLTGRPAQFAGVLPEKNNARREYSEIRITPYAQDDWRIGPSLTLNLGLRWDFMTNPKEVGGLTYTLLDPLQPTLVQVPNVYKKNPTLTNLNPRLGFAWTPTEDKKTAVRGGFGRYNFLQTARTYGLGYAREYTWQQANAVNPPFPDAVSTLRATAPITNQLLDYSDDYNVGYALTYNLNVQREIYRGAVASVGYLGSRGEHMPGVGNQNTPIPSGRTPAGQYIRLPGAPRPNPAFGNQMDYMLDEGISRYNALQLSLTGRTSSMQYLVAYDYSRCHDNGSASYNATVLGTGGTGTYSEPLDPMWDYGRCDFQATHSGKGSLVYLFPQGGNRLTSGWQASLISQLRSGLPFSAFIGYDIARFGGVGGNGARPDLVAGRDPNPVLGKPEKWFDPTAFTIATIPANTYGTLPRNTIDGPGLVNFDLSVEKETVLAGDAKLQLRVAVFNLFNRANFGIPDRTVFLNPSGVPSPTAGLITNTATPSRQVQLSARIVF